MAIKVSTREFVTGPGQEREARHEWREIRGNMTDGFVIKRVDNDLDESVHQIYIEHSFSLDGYSYVSITRNSTPWNLKTMAHKDIFQQRELSEGVWEVKGEEEVTLALKKGTILELILTNDEGKDVGLVKIENTTHGLTYSTDPN